MRCPDCGHSNSEELEKCEKCESLLDDSEETGIRPVPSADDSDVTGLRPAAPASSEDPASESEASTGYQPSPLPDVASRPGTPSPPMTPSPGSLSAGTTGELPAYVSFGNRYEILELLGEGGMGRVYKAWDRELEKVIALKTIRGEMSNNPELVKRFKQELLLARKITHKNVIRIHDLGESEGVRFFTMEYIPGESLKRMVERCGKIPGEEAVPLVKQMLSALEEAHSQGVIHRDLKPENIMIDPEGVLHIMDFGIARSAQDTGGMTAQGMMIGTPDYMSPEQVRAEKADAQSDLFSFGVILYEMLTGELPYQGDTAASRVMMRLSKKPPPLGELHGEIPKFLENMAVKCLEIDRELRYKSAHEVLQDIERESVDRSLALRAVRAVTQSKAGIAAAVATVLAVGATLYLVSPDKSPSVDSLEGPVTTLAILPFTNASGAEELEWMRTGLSEMLVTDISQSRYLRPVPGGRVMKVLTELGLSEQTRFDDAALQSVSQRAPAQSVLHGQFVEVGGTLRLDLTLREAGSGVPIPIKVEGASSEVFALVDQITEQVKQHLDLTAEQIREDTDRPMAEVSTGSLEALQAYQSGLAHLQRGANQAAIPLLKEATVEDPSFAMAYAKLADAYLDAGEHEEAEVAIEQAQTLSETASLPLVERYQIHAIAAQVKDDYEAALESYRELAKLYPDDPDIQLSLGLLYEGLGRFPEASEAYARSLELAPHYGEARFGLAYAQVLTGKLDEGIQLLQNTLASGEYEGDPEAMGMIHSILGLAYRETGDLDQAIEHFNQSLDFRVEAGDTKGQSTTLNNLAVVYMIQGDSQKSYQVREEALSIAREMGDLEDESHILADIGLAHEITGDLDKALTSYRESMQIEMERQDHYALANRLDRIANIYRLKGQYNDALVYLEQAGTHLAQSGDKRERSMNLSYTPCRSQRKCFRRCPPRRQRPAEVAQFGHNWLTVILVVLMRNRPCGSKANPVGSKPASETTSVGVGSEQLSPQAALVSMSNLVNRRMLPSSLASTSTSPLPKKGGCTKRDDHDIG